LAQHTFFKLYIFQRKDYETQKNSARKFLARGNHAKQKTQLEYLILGTGFMCSVLVSILGLLGKAFSKTNHEFLADQAVGY